MVLNKLYTFFRKALPIYLAVVLMLLPVFSSPHKAFAESGGNGAIIQAACELGGFITGFFDGVIGGATDAVKDAGDISISFDDAVPTYEKNTDLIRAAQTTAEQQTVESCSSILGSVLASLTEILKKKILDMMVDQIINWIQGGGTPQFIDDWQAFLKNAADDAAGQFIEKELGAGFLCDPFALQLQLSLIEPPTFSERATCTLSEVVGNIENFYEDFQNGSWTTYAYTWAPQNNYYGSVLLAIAELDNRRAEAQTAAQNEGLASGGFLSTKKCEKDSNGKDIPGTCKITTPGQTVAALVNKAVTIDLDWLANAEDISAYIAAIADALINRLVIAGVEGIQGLSTSKKPGGGGFNPNIFKACKGLSEPEYSTCLNYAAQGGAATDDPFGAAKADLAKTVDASLTPRVNAHTLFIDSTNKLSAYGVLLQALLSQFVLLICPNLPAYIGVVNADIAWATALISTIQTDGTANQKTVDALNKLKDKIVALKDDQWTELSTLGNEAAKTGVLNASQAVSLESGAVAQNLDIKNKIAQNEAAFNQNLTLCTLGI